MSMRRSTIEAIVAPTLADVDNIGLNGRRLDIATAFYTRGALSKLSISAAHVRFYCRLDQDNLEEWARGFVAPDALHETAGKLTKSGSDVEIFVAEAAHAKVYVGEQAGLLGSANLTVTGFGGGLEIVNRITSPQYLKTLRRSLDLYASRLTRIDFDELGDFVATNRARVKRMRRSRPPISDKLPSVRRDAIPRFGSYDGFLNWLGSRSTAGASEIRKRAYGKSNLSGHVQSSFYGLRQFLLANPDQLKRFAALHEDTYKLSRDHATEVHLSDFVSHYAADEPNFQLRTWKSYLPIECGGKQPKHGGAIGSLNRMLPLVARYLTETLRRNSA